MILGERADTELLRKGADKAITEGIIQVGNSQPIRELLEENAVEYSSELILRREIRDSGSRAFINDTPVTISVLREVGNYLVDLHGQHDHQMLLNEENHRTVIDEFEEVQPALHAYRTSYREMQELRNELKQLRKREQELQEKMELYRFQDQELEEANLDPHEEEQLQAEMKLLDNAEDLDQKAAAIIEMGTSDEINVIELLNRIKLNLEDMARIEDDFESYLEEITTARISIQEMINFTERYRAGIEFNPQRLEELRKRQAELNRLRKKYNRTIPELIEYHHEIRKELNLAENFDLEIEQLEQAISEKAIHLANKAKQLHNKRLQVGDKLSSEIVNELTQMGIPHGQFQVRVDWLPSENGWIEIDGQPVNCTEHGCDEVSFYISTNKGEPPKPLAKIASGGEISRVMLALKSALAREQSLPVMIFDEIDNGISGKISEKVGRSMRRLSTQCQIIAITHQPQIASQAHHHYKVEKREKEGRTVSRIIPLSNKQHIEEVASLMSGEEITEAALQSAQELIDKNPFRN